MRRVLLCFGGGCCCLCCCNGLLPVTTAFEWVGDVDEHNETDKESSGWWYPSSPAPSNTQDLAYTWTVVSSEAFRLPFGSFFWNKRKWIHEIYSELKWISSKACVLNRTLSFLWMMYSSSALTSSMYCARCLFRRHFSFLWTIWLRFKKQNVICDSMNATIIEMSAVNVV